MIKNKFILKKRCESVIKCLNTILKDWSVLNRLFEEIESVLKNFNDKQDGEGDTQEFSVYLHLFIPC